MDKSLNKPFVSKSKNKKYSVYVMKDGKKKLIHFGSTKYEHYFDKIGKYSKLNHGDKERRKNYLSRAKGIKDKDGNLTWKDKTSPNYWSVHKLW